MTVYVPGQLARVAVMCQGLPLTAVHAVPAHAPFASIHPRLTHARGSDIFFLYQANWTFGTGDLEIFVTTAALTLLSVTRALVQVCFALRNRARLPRVLDDDLSPMQQNLKWLTCCCPKQKTDWDKLTLGKLKVQKVDPQLRKYTSVVHLCRDTSEKKPRTELFMDKQRRMVELEPWKWIGLKALT